MAISIFEEEKKKPGVNIGGKFVKALTLHQCIKEDPKVLAKYLSAFQYIDKSIKVDEEVKEFIDNIDDSAYSGGEGRGTG